MLNERFWLTLINITCIITILWEMKNLALLIFFFVTVCIKMYLLYLLWKKGIFCTNMHYILTAMVICKCLKCILKIKLLEKFFHEQMLITFSRIKKNNTFSFFFIHKFIASLFSNQNISLSFLLHYFILNFWPYNLLNCICHHNRMILVLIP